MKKLPLGIQEFEIIRTEDYLYVDKTQEMYQLLNAGRFLFLARPRRFGKSLLISTIEAFYQGRKELFEGLWIYNHADWTVYPVLRIDFGNTYHTVTAEAFRQNLCDVVIELGEEFDISLKGSNYKSLFGELLKKLYKKTGKRVVVLVDEYDKPITDLIEDHRRQAENQVILKDFYTVIKGKSKYIQFAFLTGVSKFAKISVFSGANNFTDVSFDEQLNELVGIKESELKSYFSDYLQRFQERDGYTTASLLAKIKYWYNGYSWTGKQKVYNPHSLLHLFRDFEFKNYWYKSGTTTFLTKAILLQSQLPNFKNQVGDYENIKEPEMLFDAASIEHINIHSLLFQTGYLTITQKETLEDLIFYTLNYPNFEVRHSFTTHLIEAYAQLPIQNIQSDAVRLKRYLLIGDLDNFIILLRRFFALIPYNLRQKADEAYYHSLFQMLMTLVGIEMLPERLTSIGRIDGVLQFEKTIYIIEFKYSSKGTVAALTKQAIAQIKRNKYYEVYQTLQKKIVFLGIGFLDKEDKKRRKNLVIDYKVGGLKEDN